MAGGLSYTQACKEVSSENRAVCIICAGTIQGRSKSKTLFCTKTPRCRSAQRRYERLITRHRYSKERALEEVIMHEMITAAQQESTVWQQ
jgi:hypothetical protein